MIEAVKAPVREGETPPADLEPTPFSVSAGWGKDGAGHVQAKGPKFERGAHFRGRRAFTLPLGTWVRVEQEVVLNEPGQEDGVLRLWFDGDLKLDTTADYRDQPARLTGVVSEVVPVDQDVSPKAKDHKISITPFTVYWR